jgi:hypothetical protein
MDHAAITRIDAVVDVAPPRRGQVRADGQVFNHVGLRDRLLASFWIEAILGGSG